MKNPFKDIWSRTVKKENETDSPEIAELTNEQKLVIDVNRDFLKSEFARSDAIERKISWLLLTHAAIFTLINTILATCTGVPQILCIGCFLLYGISFVFSLLALKPVTVYYTKWDQAKSVGENNDFLCQNIDDTRKNVNVQCDRFVRCRTAFMVATSAFLLAFMYITINKIEWGENMKPQKRNYAAASAITATNNTTSAANAISVPKGAASEPKSSKPKPLSTPSVPNKATKADDGKKLTKRVII